MPAYLLAEIEITDDSWIPDYAAKVHDIVHKHDGKYLSRSANIEVLEGDPPATNVIAILEFPTMEKLKGFVNDPDYAPFGQARGKGSVSRFRAIDDTDATGAIPYLAKG